MVQTQDLMSKIWMGRWSEEEYLLEQTKHRSDIDHNDQSDLQENSSNRDMHYKRTRNMGTQKYLRKNCYHRIECPATNFLVAFMWRRFLNNTVLVTTTHRKPERVSDVTST